MKKLLNNPSFPRKWESRTMARFWIPAYAGMTTMIIIFSFLLSACGTQTTEEAGSVTIQSSPFSEIKTIAARVKAYLEIGGKTCEFELDPDDTTLKDNQKCTDIPMGSHSYKIVYKYTETGVILANTEGTITLISGKDNEIYLAPPEKDIDDDDDGFKNFYEILQGTDPKDPGSKPVEDKTPPAVSSTSPANSATNVPVNSKISATFSEAIDSKTITNETFTGSNGSTNIPGTFVINGTTATFTPSANLSYNTTYTATIGTGVKDLAGNTIAGNYSWSFVTEISAGTKPSVPTGVTAQAGDGQVTISWAAVSGATSYNIYWSTTASVSKSTGKKISNVKSPYNHTGITNGTTYHYVVTAVNSHGESGESDQTSATYTSIVTSDTTAPANTTGTNFINSGAPAANSTSVTLSISATDSVGVAGYYASENSTTPSASDTGWKSITPTTSYLAGVTFTLSSGDGAKTVYVWFKDAVGNISVSSSDIITLDTVSPDTTIINQPSTPTNSTSASFSFTSSETGTIFQCQLDNGGFSVCTSTKPYSGLADGSHTFDVRATDVANNTDPTPARYTWVLDSAAPSNTTYANFINSGAASSNSTNVLLTLSATDNVGVTGYCAKESSVMPSINDSCWTSITSTTSYSAGVTFIMSTGDGLKTAYVWFKDAAGNVSTIANDSITLGSPPSIPTGVTAAAGGGKVTVSWNTVSDATSYNIYWSTTSGVTKSTGTKISDVTAIPYIHTGRTFGTTYYYVVTAVNTFGESEQSNQVSEIAQAPALLPKTGQTMKNISGDDGDLQRGVVWPSPRFTDNGNSTVTDGLTGLAWTKDGNAPGPAACSPITTKAWQDALDYVVCLNINSYLGYTDWRLPNVNELRSLINAGQNNTASWIKFQGFNNVQSDFYWSSTSVASGTNGAWIVNMGNGGMVNGGRACCNYVWPVRSGQSGLFLNSLISLPKTGQTTCYDMNGYVIPCVGTGQDGDIQAGVPWPSPRFTDNGNGSITDNLTGLMWTKDGKTPGVGCSLPTKRTWYNAPDHAACLNSKSYLGYTDWRLPNVNELRSLVNAGQVNMATWLNTQGFNNVQGSLYWSSTLYTFNISEALLVNMDNGGIDQFEIYTHEFYVWAVRSGQ